VITGNYDEKDRSTSSPDTNLDSRVSFTPSVVSQYRARTPGGSPASPVPYNPSEISDDTSAHFTLLPQDHKVGVPVPFPLALHVPSRVAQAMSERDERWKEYELQRQTYGGADDFSETSTIPRPLSRMPQRRSTLRSVTSGGTSPSDAYAGIDSPRNSRRSTWENHDYFASEPDRSRSEVAANDHRNSLLQRGGQSGRSSLISDFPTPPLPSFQQVHHRDSSSSSIPHVRRLPPLPPTPRTPTEEFPFAAPTESPLRNAENPFLTETNLNAPGMSSISERSSVASSEELTALRHGEDWSAPVVGAVTGVARTASARTMHYLGRTGSNPFGRRPPPSQNPFADGPSRFSAADSIATADDTVDTHQIHRMVANFPTPPDPTQRRIL
jgi:hypothetical protein